MVSFFGKFPVASFTRINSGFSILPLNEMMGMMVYEWVNDDAAFTTHCISFSPLNCSVRPALSSKFKSLWSQFTTHSKIHTLCLYAIPGTSSWEYSWTIDFTCWTKLSESCLIPSLFLCTLFVTNLMTFLLTMRCLDLKFRICKKLSYSIISKKTCNPSITG